MKKIPVINIVLALIMLGILTAGIVGLVKYIKSTDREYNNYVKSTFNAPLSRYYTDSLSLTQLSELGTVEIEIYDSVENSNQRFVFCRISNSQEVVTINEAKLRALSVLLAVFPGGEWNGDLTFRFQEALSIRWFTVPIHPKQLEIESTWSD
jgi:hypothetical protein